jgi:hypothetical protein
MLLKKMRLVEASRSTGDAYLLSTLLLATFR